MGKQRNRQLQDGRGTSNYQYKKEGRGESFVAQDNPEKFLSERKIELKPRNEKQRKYIEYLQTKSLIIATGFAGSSKTFCPTMIAAQKLRDKEIDRIILIRTPVSDEQSVGMLKGDLIEKTKFWLMPILDTLNKALSPTLVEYLIKREQILCLAPEFLKGVSFTERDFVIFDEAEDMSRSIALATVTRQGGGTMALCGDLRQQIISRESGLPLLLDIIEKSPALKNRVGVIDFNSFDDIVRSDDCKEWVKALVKHGYM
jgi:phosphate starvation-inducible protein PhoH and related proteins